LLGDNPYITSTSRRIKMKGKAIIILMLIAIVAISTTIAYATDFTSSQGSLSSNGWTTTSGSFGGTFGSPSPLGIYGIYSNSTSGISRAVNAMNLNPNGTHAFDLKIQFTINNLNESIWLGVANASTSTTDQLLAGYAGSGSWATSQDGSSGTQAMTSATAPANGTNYVADISSSDGKTITFTIQNQDTFSTVAGPVSLTMPSGGLATYAVLEINNNGYDTSPSPKTSDIVTHVQFADNGGGSATGTVTPTPTPTPTPATTATTGNPFAGAQNFYANQPVVHMSNQSVIYWPNGSIKQVIGGNAVVTPTAMPVVSATPAPPASATTTPTVVPPTVTVAPSATQTKSPGFEILLAAIGMILALALVSRKR
jgi:PGF-CTERM motif